MTIILCVSPLGVRGLMLLFVLGVAVLVVVHPHGRLPGVRPTKAIGAGQ